MLAALPLEMKGIRLELMSGLYAGGVTAEVNPDGALRLSQAFQISDTIVGFVQCCARA